MSEMKPIKVYGTWNGPPNPYKVVIVLEELNLPYQKIHVEDSKAEWYTALNPNGRVPTIQDENTEITLWESGAIITYLVDTYDKNGKLIVDDMAGKWQLQQYLHFQMSGQGPYYGQAMWFFRNGDIPIAKQRYINEIARVIGVLDRVLEGKEYLVGDKLTYADLAFIPWNIVIKNYPHFSDALWKSHDIEKKCPNYFDWQKRLAALDSVRKAYEG